MIFLRSDRWGHTAASMPKVGCVLSIGMAFPFADLEISAIRPL